MILPKTYPITLSLISSYMRGKGYFFVSSPVISWWSKIVPYHSLKVKIEITRQADGRAPEAFTDPVTVSFLDLGTGEECMQEASFASLKDFFGINVLEKIKNELDNLYEGI